MAANINQVSMSGYLVADSELRTTQGGSSLLSFRIVCNESRKNSQSGEYEDYPNYFDCTLFGDGRAKSLAPYLKVRTKVFVEGRLHQSRWENAGQKRSSVSIVVNSLEFNTPRNNNAVQNDGAQNNNNMQNNNAVQNGRINYSNNNPNTNNAPANNTEGVEFDYFEEVF